MVRHEAERAESAQPAVVPADRALASRGWNVRNRKRSFRTKRIQFLERVWRAANAQSVRHDGNFPTPAVPLRLCGAGERLGTHESDADRFTTARRANAAVDFAAR